MTEHYFVQKPRIFQRQQLVFDDFDIRDQKPSIELAETGSREGEDGVVILFSEEGRAARSTQLDVEMQNGRFVFINKKTQKSLTRLSRASGPFWERMELILPKINSTSPIGVYEFGIHQHKLMILDMNDPKANNIVAVGLTLGDNGTFKESMRFTKMQKVSSRFSKGPVEFNLVDEYNKEYRIKDGKFQVKNVLYTKHNAKFVAELLLSKGTGQFLNTRLQVQSCSDLRLQEFYSTIEKAICDDAAKVPPVLMIKDLPSVPGLQKYGMKIALMHQYAVAWAFKKAGSEHGLGHILSHNERLLYHAFNCNTISELTLSIGESVPIPDQSVSAKSGPSLSSNGSDSGSTNNFGCNFNRADGYVISEPIHAPHLDHYMNEPQKPSNDMMVEDPPKLGDIPYEQPRILGKIPYEQPQPKPYAAPKVQQHFTPPFRQSPDMQHFGDFNFCPPQDKIQSSADNAFMASFQRSLPTRNDGFIQSNAPVSNPTVVFQPQRYKSTDVYEETFMDEDGDTLFQTVG